MKKKSIPVIWSLAISAAILVPVVNGNQEQLNLLQDDVAILESRLAKLEGSTDSGSTLTANVEAAEKEITETIEGLGERERKLFESEYLLSVYQSAFRVVTSLERGDSLGTITMPGGQVLKKVVFVDVSNGTVNLQTSAGFKNLNFNEVPASIAGKFQLPPNIPVLASSIEAIYAIKPGAALSDAENSPVSNTSQSVAKAASNDEEQVQNKGEADSGTIPEYMQVKTRNDARIKRIEQIRTNFMALKVELKALKVKRNSEEAKFASASIKKAQSTQDKVLIPIDNKIEALDAKITALKSEMAAVRSAFE